MPDTHALVERPSQGQLAVYDAIVIGAGISSMYMLYRLRELGMTARVFEAGTNLGGTWYWNRYPGARFDSESWTYGYSFSKELMAEWDWKEHFSPQPDTLEYLNYAADKFDLRRDIQVRSTVAAAHWDEAANRWSVTLESGEQATAWFLFTAIGILSAYTLPAIPGRARSAKRAGRSFTASPALVSGWATSAISLPTRKPMPPSAPTSPKRSVSGSRIRKWRTN